MFDSLVIAARSLQVPRVHRSVLREVFGRACDLLIIVVLLPLIVPVALLIGAAIFADSPGPILYRAPRVGRDGRPFTMLKFRKMLRDASGSTLTVANDERFTPIGRFLTASRLDELPQLWNVIRGDMRLVGPRPETIDFVSRHRREYQEILSLRPGLTGPAQLEHFNEGMVLDGHEDPERHYLEEILPRKIVLDLGYVRGKTLLNDFGLLTSTFVLPLRVLAAKLGHALRLRGATVRIEMVVLTSALLVMIAFLAGTGPPR